MFVKHLLKVTYIAVEPVPYTYTYTNRTLIHNARLIKAEILQKVCNASRREKPREHTRGSIKTLSVFPFFFSFKLITRVRYWYYQSAADARDHNRKWYIHLPWYAIRAAGDRGIINEGQLGGVTPT